jgi:hypothetical protein
VSNATSQCLDHSPTAMGYSKRSHCFPALASILLTLVVHVPPHSLVFACLPRPHYLITKHRDLFCQQPLNDSGRRVTRTPATRPYALISSLTRVLLQLYSRQQRDDRKYILLRVLSSNFIVRLNFAIILDRNGLISVPCFDHVLLYRSSYRMIIARVCSRKEMNWRRSHVEPVRHE